VSNIGKTISWRLECFAYDTLCFLLTPFSFGAISGAGGWLLRKIGPLTSKHKIAETGLRLAFPDKSDDEIKQLLKEQWDNTGRTFAEFPVLHKLKVFGEDSRIKVNGLENLDTLKNRDLGVILFSGHFANWELMAAVFAQYDVPVRVTYRRINNPYLDKRVMEQREAYGIKFLVQKSTHRGGRELFEALKQGENVAILNDQKFNPGVSVPFFGEPAMTANGAVRLAMKTGTPLVPMSITRDKARFTVTVHPPMTVTKTGNREADVLKGVTRVTEFIEDRIRENPGQWFWVHRRWPNEVYQKD